MVSFGAHLEWSVKLWFPHAQGTGAAWVPALDALTPRSLAGFLQGLEEPPAEGELRLDTWLARMVCPHGDGGEGGVGRSTRRSADKA